MLLMTVVKKHYSVDSCLNNSTSMIGCLAAMVIQQDNMMKSSSTKIRFCHVSSAGAVVGRSTFKLTDVDPTI